VRQAFQEAYQKIAAKAHIKGFRPGKAPVGIIRMKHGASIAREVTENLIQDAYGKALEEHALHPIGSAELTSELPELGEGDSFSFSMEVDVYPELALPEYMGLPIGAERYEVSEGDVDAELGRVVERHANIEDKAEGALEAGDLAIVNYEVLDGGKVIDVLTREGYSYDLKMGASYPNFQDILRGKTAGESFEIASAIPEKFPIPELINKDVVFKGSIVKMQKRVLPLVDDEFVAGISDAKTVAEFRALLRERMEEYARQYESTKTRQKILDYLVEKTEFELPQTILNEQVESAMEEFKRRLEKSKLDMETELTRLGKTVESVREEFAAEAEREARAQICLSEIRKKENIQAEEVDIAEALDEYAHYYGVDREAMREHFTKSGEMESMVWRIVRRKTLEALEKAAVITVEKTLPFEEIRE